MADDRMKKKDLNRNMGDSGRRDSEYGKQTHGRNPKDDDRSTGQRGGNQPRRDVDDNILDFEHGPRPDKKQGGQNR